MQQAQPATPVTLEKRVQEEIPATQDTPVLLAPVHCKVILEIQAPLVILVIPVIRAQLAKRVLLVQLVKPGQRATRGQSATLETLVQPVTLVQLVPMDILETLVQPAAQA